jgi:hypothetical protein
MKTQKRGVALFVLILFLTSAQPAFARSRDDFEFRDVTRIIQKWVKAISKLVPKINEGLTDPKP